MGIFGDRPECRPPQEFDSFACYQRWAETELINQRRASKTNLALQVSGYRTASDEAMAKSQIQVNKSRAAIDASREKLNELLVALAKKTTGASGIAKGEFEKDAPLKTPPKTRKIKKVISPSVQIAGLETKAVASGLPSRFYTKTEERPM
jgi:hypothetical protein